MDTLLAIIIGIPIALVIAVLLFKLFWFLFKVYVAFAVLCTLLFFVSVAGMEIEKACTPVTSTTVTQQDVPAPTSSTVTLDTSTSKPRLCNADGEQCFATEGQTKEWNCQFPSYSDNGAGLPNVSDKAWDGYCMSTVLRWQDYKLSHHTR
jgi:hypothetical protein